MEPVRSVAAPPPLPVAWLQGDVLAEYLRFLEEEAPEPQPTRVRGVPVAWLQGEVRDEFLRFLEESAAAACPAELQLQEEKEEEEEEEEEHGSDDDGVVVDADDDYESFVSVEEDDDDDACAMEDDESRDGGGVVFVMDMEEADDPVLELLLPHILDLPAFRARAAGVPQQQQQQRQRSLAFPRQGGCGSMSSDGGDEMTGEFPRQDGWTMSSDDEDMRC